VETGAGGTAGAQPWLGVGAGLAAAVLFVAGAVMGRRTRRRPHH
jgi:drug/metabolite transporter (DMT)-like permease